MKKVHLLVLKAFIRPFIVTFFIVMFLLLMLFLFKYIDDLIGKGFEWYVILKLLMYAAATNVAMALPLAILLSSIMTFGNLGENYELVAIKSAGISLQKAMAPLFILVTFLGIGAFLFSDYMLPIANLKMGALLYDVREQKAAFLIEEGVFNNSIPGYSIRVEKKENDGQILKDIVIYDQTKGQGNTNILMAKEGEMYKTDDGNFLILRLKDGVRYEENTGKTGYNPRQELTRLRFKETEQKFDLSSFQFKREDENLFKGNYQMLNIKQLLVYKDSVTHLSDSISKNVFKSIAPYHKIFYATQNYRIAKTIKNITFKKDGVLAGIDSIKRESVFSGAKDNIRTIKESINEAIIQKGEKTDVIRRYRIEYNRKFTLAVSCLVLFFIGAPLGAIIRKGGLGLPVVVSVLFFLIYHIISTVGEKSVKVGNMDPVWGMWMAIFVLTPIGLFLTYKATVDSALFDVDFYKNFFKKIFRKTKSS
ncbi:LptF/LptG family permease [Pedobacter alpinus]|uniref:LptF/LptG family permease n=1 Tax=Pedobacter alpinus TaxID=1590643 RepID=A0ABW5TTJ7_9SPHI